MRDALAVGVRVVGASIERSVMNEPFEVDIVDATPRVRVTLLCRNVLLESELILARELSGVAQLADLSVVQQVKHPSTELQCDAKLIGERYADLLRQFCHASRLSAHMRDRLYVATFASFHQSLYEPTLRERSGLEVVRR
jgi:hypothetical protein